MTRLNWFIFLVGMRHGNARRERMEPAVAAAGQRLAQPFEAWIAADRSRGGVRALFTGLRKDSRVRARRSDSDD
jgi:hypothetical protein